ncbi:biotin/lipoyl-binding protein [bacterium]|nr:biotin/lipoyl-binding protein [bacterium]
MTIKTGDRVLEVIPGDDEIEIDGIRYQCHSAEIDKNTVSILLEGKVYLFRIIPNGSGYLINWRGGEYELEMEDERTRMMNKFMGGGTAVKSRGMIKAPMPGLVVKILVEEGQEVKKGAPVIVVEAMKMENEIVSPVNGIVKEIKVDERQVVEKGETLIIIGE